ncbi:terminus macrodomain insulation protein YfbV [Orbaceae bacterium ESL0721]|nr:terminus macrodomain insulation protein YfbV [Orbaceae bacterium ESL0721]
MNVVKIFKTGQQYMRLCPQDKRLATSFPEIKIINYIKLANRYLPPAVIALFLWQYFMHAPIAIIVVTALFALSLPLQGILWLGRRALSPLPLTLLSMYNQLQQQLITKNIIPKTKPTAKDLNFIEFIKLLNLAKTHLGSYFGDNDNDNDSNGRTVNNDSDHNKS